MANTVDQPRPGRFRDDPATTVAADTLAVGSPGGAGEVHLFGHVCAVWAALNLAHPQCILRTMRTWLSRTYDYITYDWLITLIIAVGVVVVGFIALTGGSSPAVMVTTLVVGVIMGIMVGARQHSLASHPRKKARKRR